MFMQTVMFVAFILALLPWTVSALAKNLELVGHRSAWASTPIVTIPLDKQYVPVVRNEKIVSYKTAYFGKVFLGMPQQQVFTVVFDTGSGHFFLPSARCTTETCLKHSRFNRTKSVTAVDLDHDGHAVAPNAKVRDQVNIAYGTGEVTGEFVRETVCLADHTGSALEDLQKKQECVPI